MTFLTPEMASAIVTSLFWAIIRYVEMRRIATKQKKKEDDLISQIDSLTSNHLPKSGYDSESGF